MLMRSTVCSIPFKDTSIFGLTKEPVLEGNLRSIDWWEDFENQSGLNVLQEKMKPGIYGHFDMHHETLRQLIIKNNIKKVMEIGVYRSEDNSRSSTDAILTALSESNNSTFYLGIDLVCKKHLSQKYNNCTTLQISSDNQDEIRLFLKNRNIPDLDLLFIDGDHSVDMMINDWKYSDLVKEGGFVVFHDVSFHPGPKLIYECIDSDIFHKTKLEIPGDWGVAVCKRKQN